MILDRGTYKMTVTRAEPTKTRHTGDPMIRVTLLSVSDHPLDDGVDVKHCFVMVRHSPRAFRYFTESMNAFGVNPSDLDADQIASRLIGCTALVTVDIVEYQGNIFNQVGHVRSLPGKHARFMDHDLKQYEVDGGIGMTVRGTRTRVWINAFNRRGQRTPSRSIRFDLHTAYEFYTAFGQALKDAECDAELFAIELERSERSEGVHHGTKARQV